jgi:hypothetical protein
MGYIGNLYTPLWSHLTFPVEHRRRSTSSARDPSIKMDEHRRMSLGHLKNLLTRQTSSQSPEPPPCPPKQLLDALPTEILIQIFSNLELIDACCLSLSSFVPFIFAPYPQPQANPHRRPRLYAINTSLNPAPTPLTTPCPISSLRLAALGSPAFEHAVIRWRTSILQHKKFVGPPPLCPHSCSQDCALHFHIRGWMPAETLFCGVCEKFANWVQVDGFRCPCKGVRRVRAGREAGESGGRGVLGRWRRRRGGREGGGDRRSEEGARGGSMDDVQISQGVQIGVI